LNDWRDSALLWFYSISAIFEYFNDMVYWVALFDLRFAATSCYIQVIVVLFGLHEVNHDTVPVACLIACFGIAGIFCRGTGSGVSWRELPPHV
jgi:hypothetical protein